MHDSTRRDFLEPHELVRIISPVTVLGLVAIVAPFAVLINNRPPPDTPYFGYDSSVRIYLWAAWFSAGFIHQRYVIEGSITQFHALPFVVMTFIYCVVQLTACIKEKLARYGVLTDVALSLIWVSICQVIYGTLQQFTLIQTPLLPLASIIFILNTYLGRRKN